MSADSDIMVIHDVIDNIENELRLKLGCDTTIHMDPVVTNDERVSETKDAVIALVKEMDERLTIHDFRMVDGPSHTNLIFDAVVPHNFSLNDREIKENIQNLIHSNYNNYYYYCVFIVFD